MHKCTKHQLRIKYHTLFFSLKSPYQFYLLPFFIWVKGFAFSFRMIVISYKNNKMTEITNFFYFFNHSILSQKQ